MNKNKVLPLLLDARGDFCAQLYSKIDIDKNILKYMNFILTIDVDKL